MLVSTTESVGPIDRLVGLYDTMINNGHIASMLNIYPVTPQSYGVVESNGAFSPDGRGSPFEAFSDIIFMAICQQL